LINRSRRLTNSHEDSRIGEHSLRETVFRFGIGDRLELRFGYNFETGPASRVAEGDIAGNFGIDAEQQIVYGLKYAVTRESPEFRLMPHSAFLAQLHTPVRCRPLAVTPTANSSFPFHCYSHPEPERAMTIKRRWFRFSLRATIGLIAVCGILLAFVTRPAQQRKRAIADIRAAGGTIQFHIGSAGSWIDKIVGKTLGPDAVARVFTVSLRNAKVDGNVLVCFRALPELKELDLEGAQVSDGGLEHLRSLEELRSLMLGGTAISDAGLAKLAQLRLPRLRTLSIQGTKITDAGLSEIAKLSGLTDLWLNTTKTTDQGLENLVPLKSLEDLGLRGTPVTSRGLAYLKQMPKLEKIRLYMTAVDDIGVQHLSEIPTLSLVDLASTKITDAAFRSLALLPNLESLDVSDTNVSAEALKMFQQPHPKCRIESYGIRGGQKGS